MSDVWLMLFAAAVMLSALPVIRGLDAYIGARRKREAEEAQRDAQAAEDFSRANRED